MCDNKKPRKFKRKGMLILCSFLLLSLGALTYKVGAGWISSYKNLGKSELREEDVNIETHPFSILLTGIDQQLDQPSSWRPDTLILAIVNPIKKSIKLVSIPRDLYTNIANTNIKDKINHSAAHAIRIGLDPDKNIKETVEKLLKVPIDYYVKINFLGFTSLIDSLGGVDVTVKKGFTGTMLDGRKKHYAEGINHLTGEQALAYVRMRYQDPQGDAGRNQRQREVLLNLADKINSMKGLLNFNTIINTVGNNVMYNFQISEIPKLISTYKACKNNIESFRIKTYGQHRKGHPWYEILSDSERTRVVETLQKEFTNLQIH